MKKKHVISLKAKECPCGEGTFISMHYKDKSKQPELVYSDCQNCGTKLFNIERVVQVAEDERNKNTNN